MLIDNRPMKKIQRREFLRRIALASASAGVVSFLPSCHWGNTAQSRHIAIVGAGMAGLTAAYELEQAGWKVTVLEAQDRVGGRVYSIHDGFAEGQYAEAGGEFIDGPRIHSQMHHYIGMFDPALPPALQSAVDELGYATHTKVLLQYSEKFWRELRLSEYKAFNSVHNH